MSNEYAPAGAEPVRSTEAEEARARRPTQPRSYRGDRSVPSASALCRSIERGEYPDRLKSSEAGAPPKGVKSDRARLPDEGCGLVHQGPQAMQYAQPHVIDLLLNASSRAVARVQQLAAERAKASGAALDERRDPRMIVHDVNTHDGRLPGGHLTHGDGRNADVGYFYTSEGGRGISNEFRKSGGDNTRYETKTRLKANGERVKWTERFLREPAADWDVEANWMFVEELLNAPEAEVTQILVDPVYAKLLEAKAREVLKDAEALKRAVAVIQFDGNHDNHFHISATPRPKQ